MKKIIAIPLFLITLMLFLSGFGLLLKAILSDSNKGTAAVGSLFGFALSIPFYRVSKGLWRGEGLGKPSPELPKEERKGRYDY